MYIALNDIQCDKYDYATAVTAGVLTGLIDSFFVGSPLASPLGRVTDTYMDHLVIRFASWVYDLDKKQKFSRGTWNRRRPSSIAGAIGFLEERFRVNYDARYAGDLIGGKVLTHFSPGNHHLKSLAHCPDVVGLFFSILDQLTERTSVINGGRIVRLAPVACGGSVDGRYFVERVARGVVNWVGHLMSDMAGSSGTRGHVGRRGMGIPIPGFELWQLVGKNIHGEISMLEKLTSQMFQNGYDFRFGVTMAIPVMLNDAFVKIFWALRQRFCFGESWGDIWHTMKRDHRLARMLTVSKGCFSVIDAGDAAIRAKGEFFVFAMHMNYVGLCAFAKDVCHDLALCTSDYVENLIC